MFLSTDYLSNPKWTTIPQTYYSKNVIDNTVTIMQSLIKKYQVHPLVRYFNNQILKDIEPYNKLGELTAIYNFVRDNVRYTSDPQALDNKSDTEYIQAPNYMLQLIQRFGKATGDCDDMTTLGLTLLSNIGFHVRIKVAGYRGSGYSHVYGQVLVKSNWINFDAIRPNKQLGWETPNITSSKLYS